VQWGRVPWAMRRGLEFGSRISWPKRGCTRRRS
jgi:hypothetical protein